MSFYVWDTPEVAKHLNVSYSSKHHFYVSIDGTCNTVYKDDSRTYIGKSSIEEMMLLGIPEYRLHPAHGLIPANSKLFKEDTNKEHKEKQMKQPVKKVFEVGDKCVIRNPSNYELMEEVKKYFIDKECKIVAKFKLSIPMVVVELDTSETSDMFGVCVVFREEMCYPVKTHKEETIDKMKEVCDYKGSWSSLYQQFASDLYDAGFRFESDVE
ncbi:hypothetical protein BNCALIDO_00005 [Aeromonas phage vB_AdhM_TS9]|nr:hypothetical protein BNCALIDO_00005 [Aeromonas phage vB_AdhM_TS9]